MADETQTEEEPSIEEILDSIRQIISEDEGEEDGGEPAEAAAVESEPEPDPEPEPEPVEEEPMDQSAIDDIDFDAPVAEPEPEPEPEQAEEEEPLELTEKVATGEDQLEVDMVDEPEPEPEPDVEEEEIAAEEPEEERAPEPDEPEEIAGESEEILTDQAKEAAYTAMTELVRKTAIDHSHGVTLEDIVRTELKPLLRAWLDKHLPVVIDRLVREELERVSKRVLEE